MFIPVYYLLGQQHKYQVFMNTLLVILLIAFIVSNILMVFLILEKLPLINNLSGIKCGDIISNQIFQTIGNNIEKLLDYCFMILYIVISLLALLVLKCSI